jgi:SAM-dependent methyltransferase
MPSRVFALAAAVAASLAVSPGLSAGSTLLAQSPAPIAQPAPPATPARLPDVIYVPTPEAVVNAMLEVARVTRNDVVYDLGCGDGRIVIAAAKKYGSRGVGIDIDPQRLAEARANALSAGVADRVEFRQEDLFEADIREATVVTLYLLPSLNLRLLPKLERDLRPGTRLVSHAFDMGDWTPEQHLEIDGRHVYYWKLSRD